MLIVISPAKNLDYETQSKTKIHSQPQMLSQAQALVEICKEFSPPDLGRLMGISEKLAYLNAVRFEDWQTPFTTENSKQAVLAFNGDVYSGLNASSLEEKDLSYAQDHLRILSGLYGILRPLDLIQAYRLEMGTRLKNPQGINLYQYWGSEIAENLKSTMRVNEEKILVNLASDEYFKSIDLNALQATIVTPVFKDQKKGKYKIISFFAKKARGLMTHFIIKNRIKDVKSLQKFDTAGYYYSEENSQPLRPVFLREEVV